MEKLAEKYLYDILESIVSIENYLEGINEFSQYQSYKMLRRAVEREFEIIGEALNKLHQVSPDIDISSKQKIVAMRNRVIHGYDKVDDEIVWGVILKHLPILKKEVTLLLSTNL